MKYSLLCVDMDGTLLNSDKKIDDRTIEAIKQASNKGVNIVICTGRLFTSAQYYADLLGIKAPIISANGAYIREKDRNEVIYKSILGKDNCMRILNVLKEHGICPNFHTPNSIFTDDVDSLYTRYMNFNSNVPENQRINIRIVENWSETFDKYEDEIVKCITVDNNLEKIKSAKKAMNEIEGVEVVSSHENNFEVMQEGVSKGRGVEILAGYYGISREEVICVGDNENDLSMIEYAGMGVAMANSEEMVLKIADYVTATNDNSGVAEVIEKFILRDA